MKEMYPYPHRQPLTPAQAKVNILGGAEAALKKMLEDGLPLEAIPSYLGGTNAGTSMLDTLVGYITENQAKAPA